MTDEQIGRHVAIDLFRHDLACSKLERKEALELLRYNSNVIHKTMNGETDSREVKALDMAIKALEAEPLTDTEQRIFLAAMSREEKVCKEDGANGDGWRDLTTVCRSIERKVKRALWG